MTSKHRVCNKCKILKPIEDFYKSNPSVGCKPCKKKKTKQDQIANRERWRKYSKRWYFKMSRNKDKYQKYLLIKKERYRIGKEV